MKSSLLILTLTLVLSSCTSSKPAGPAGRDVENPLYSLTLMRAGSLLLQQGRFDAALDKFKKADKVAPGNGTVLNMMGLCHLRLERYDQALLSFDKALAQIPAFTDARNNRGATYMAMGQYRMAEVDFIAVLSDSTYPHRFSVFYNLGMTYLQRGLTSAAKENFHNALDPDQPVFEAYLRLAEIEQQEGYPDEAVSLLEEATHSFPNRIEAPLALGRLLTNLGRKSEAEPYLREVIADEPRSEFAAEARRMIGEN
ncbi:MAG: hypothetical protein DRJ61_00410 [Acidobacteria bacterium]|nr:MAG: hypothetical protein DRJ61_00410 [Acidobacteriota bacterium]